MHPAEKLQNLASENKLNVHSREFAEFLDAKDDLRGMRDRFYYPKMKDLPTVDPDLVDGEEDCIYFSNHSCGLQPKNLRDYLNRQLDKWAKCGVFGYMLGEQPWSFVDEVLQKDCGELVGALPEEVAIMNSLTINNHILLLAFYQPTNERHIILTERKPFPSDYYVLESQIRIRGFDPDTSIISINPREGEHTLRTEDILDVIAQRGKEIAVIFFGGVQYYTGQFFDMAAITRAGHEQGCYVGFDIAHGVGNVEFFLHDWDVDFACWCAYKYLCGGPGGVGGAFLHDKHRHTKFQIFEGWWGHKLETRFQMTNQMDRSEGISGFRISNPSMLHCTALMAGLAMFGEVGGIKPLRKKSVLLNGYMEMLLKENFTNRNSSEANKDILEIVSPSNPAERGALLSVAFHLPTDFIERELEKRGVACDERRPNVIRFSPAPLYNSFLDIYRFIEVLKTVIMSAK